MKALTEAQKQSRRDYYQRNKDKLRECTKEWIAKNQERYGEWKKKYYRDRFQNDPRYRARAYYQVKLSKYLDGIRKGYFWEQRKPFIGCTTRELKAHLEAQFRDGMTWENYGKVWTVDHIVPRSAFKLEDNNEVLRCFHYKNLRPLLKEENKYSPFSVIRDPSTEPVPGPTPAAIYEMENFTPPCRGKAGRTDPVDLVERN